MKHRSTYLYFLFTVSLLSCHEPSKLKEPATYKKPGSNHHDTMIIEKRAAVFYFPDSLQIKKIREGMEPRIYDGTFHEFEYLVKNARNILNIHYPQIPILEARKTRFILFRGMPGALIDLDSVGDPIGLYMFDPNKPPRLADMANIVTELPAYFKDTKTPDTFQGEN